MHEFQRKAEVGTVTSQGWDPTYAVRYQEDKDRLVAGIATYSVGLPGSLEPDDLGETGCPLSTDIRSSDDVENLPLISLTGVDGPVHLIHDCNAERSILRVRNGVKVAVWGSAFRQLQGVSGSTGNIWVVDSLINGAPDDNAGISCLGATPCVVMYSEVLGGDDIMKMNPGDVCFRSHLHAYDRDSTSGPASGSGVTVQPPGFSCGEGIDRAIRS